MKQKVNVTIPKRLLQRIEQNIQGESRSEKLEKCVAVGYNLLRPDCPKKDALAPEIYKELEESLVFAKENLRATYNENYSVPSCLRCGGIVGQKHSSSDLVCLRCGRIFVLRKKNEK
jgi:predicted RNA-binding Zn-ribbon protein involved in translation (DUF1610 family)